MWCCACVLGRLPCWSPTTSSGSSTSCAALERTPVRAPRALWLEDTGDVLGRPFFVMERLPGDVYEMALPTARCDARTHPSDVPRHGRAARGDSPGRPGCDGPRPHSATDATISIASWTTGQREMHRVQRGPLPALERLLAASERDQAASVPDDHARPRRREARQLRVRRRRRQRGLRLGDDHRRRSAHRHRLDGAAVDAAGRDHQSPVGADASRSSCRTTSRSAASASQNRSWYRALNAYKMAVICLIGSMLFDSGDSDDQRFVLNAYGISPLTQLGLAGVGHRREARRRPGHAPQL